jgi:hypothetical protein
MEAFSLLTWAAMLGMGYRRGIAQSSGMIYYFYPGTLVKSLGTLV